MASVTLNITDADAGTVLAGAFTDGFISELKLLRLGLAYENPDFNMGLGRFVAGRIALRGTLDYKPLYSINPYFASMAPGFKYDVNLLPYKGDLFLESVPTSSSWAITVHDAPVFVRSTSRAAQQLAPPMQAIEAPRPVPVGR